MEPSSQRRRLNNGSASEDNGDEDLVAIDNYNDSSYPNDEGEYWAQCASQTDNPNTPLGGHNGDDSDGPRLRHLKSIQDRVHGQIELGGLLVAVMDTAEFQRLDRVRQLGGCYFVYPSATHTRKEHSIGVAHLAGFMARHLAKSQPELEIDEADVLCVELAGLVHDLGHGPFSHMFEEFMSEATPPNAPKWEHEEMSGKLLRRLLRVNEVPVADYFPDCSAADAEEHINFVVKLIEGLKDEAKWPDDIGRRENKRFLFDIVSNKRNGIDVDKLDYLVRDGMAAFGCSAKLPGFDIYRIIESSRVLHRTATQPGRTLGHPGPEVCFQVKNALEILEIYSFRAKLHRQVYQHRIANVTEAMVTDVFLMANDHFRVKGGKDAAGMRISDAAHDEAAFVRLNDSVLDALDLSTNEGLGPAQALLERLKRRDFYRQVGNQLNIETLPRCTRASCRAGTKIDALYCHKCGETTMTRKKVADKTGVYRSEGMLITEGEIKKALLNLLPAATRVAVTEADALICKIVDIQIGKQTTKKDAHSLLWVTYDPLAKVGFYNPKAVHEKTPIALLPWESYPQIYLPAACHTRTLYCYLRSEEAGWRPAIETALASWSEDMQFTDQAGTSNMASPAAHLGGSGSGWRRGASDATPRGMNSGGRASLAPSNVFGDAFGDNRRLSTISESSGHGATCSTAVP